MNTMHITSDNDVVWNKSHIVVGKLIVPLYPTLYPTGRWRFEPAIVDGKTGHWDSRSLRELADHLDSMSKEDAA